jgi:AcrR family transcriptional regulator
MPKIVDHPARRDEISAIAASLIAEGGMERTTIREIASRSGFSKGVIEHYFEGKEELISAALDSINQGYEQRVHNSAVGLSGLSALRQRILATLPVNRTIRNEWKVRLAFWSIAAIESKLCARQTERFEKAVAVYANDIALAIERGEIPAGNNAEPLAHRLFTSTIGISTAALYKPPQAGQVYLQGELEYLMQRLALGH